MERLTSRENALIKEYRKLCGSRKRREETGCFVLEGARLVLDAALGFPAELPMPPYLHVLGARKAALPRLKQASLPAATALADLARTGPEAAKISRLHNKAVDFSSLCREKIQPMGLAFTAKPVVI